MVEKLGPGEIEDLRMKLNKKLHHFMTGKNLSEMVQLLGAQEFCDYEGKNKDKIVKFRAADFISSLIESGRTEIFGEDIENASPDTKNTLKTKKLDSAEFGTKPEKTPDEWMNAQEIEEYLKTFNPKITRHTLLLWIKEMEPLDAQDHGVFNKNKNIPSMCYSRKIVQKLKERLTAQKLADTWLTKTEMARKLSEEKELHASEETVEWAIQELGLIYGHDYEDRLDKMNRKKPHYSKYVMELVRKLHRERGERAPEGWMPLKTLLTDIQDRNPDQLKKDHDYRKKATNYIRGLNLVPGQDFKLYLNHHNQPMIHYSPAVTEQIEKFLISEENK